MQIMTIEQAKQIIKTYSLPMTESQLRDYKIALKVLSSNWAKQQN